MPDEQLYELMWEMKNLVQKNSEQATQLLAHNPQFATVILLAQQKLSMLTPQTVQQLLSAPMQEQVPSGSAALSSASASSTSMQQASGMGVPSMHSAPQHIGSIY